VFDAEVFLDADKLDPFVTWGTNPGQGVSLLDVVPNPADIADPNEKAAAERALEYMDLKPGTKMKDIRVDTVFWAPAPTPASRIFVPQQQSLRVRKKLMAFA
jgi:3-isopropylmalate/(R)-2-methylmalate dehydratase large subunit